MNKYIGPLLILIAAVSWSTAGLFTRVVTTDIPTTLFWRSLFGGMCVLVIVLLRDHKTLSKNVYRFSLGEVVIASLSTAGMICFISAFFYTTIANVSFVYGVMPLVTYIFAVLFLKEPISSLAVSCCVVSAAGMSLMTFGSSNLDDYIGILLAFGMTMFMAALTVAAKFFPAADSAKATYLSAFIGALIVIPFATFTNINPNDYYWLALYGFVNVGLGFGIYLLGVMRVTALAAALIGLIEIPLAPIWALLLFDEQVGKLTIVGGGIIFISAAFYLVKSTK